MLVLPIDCHTSSTLAFSQVACMWLIFVLSVMSSQLPSVMKTTRMHCWRTSMGYPMKITCRSKTMATHMQCHMHTFKAVASLFWKLKKHITLLVHLNALNCNGWAKVTKKMQGNFQIQVIICFKVENPIVMNVPHFSMNPLALPPYSESMIFHWMFLISENQPWHQSSCLQRTFT